MTITVVCDRGTTRFENHRHRWRWMIHPDGPWHDEPHEPFARDALFIAQANAFLDPLEGHGLPLCSLEEGIQTLRVNLAALASLEQRTWQTIEPGKPGLCRFSRGGRWVNRTGRSQNGTVPIARGNSTMNSEKTAPPGDVDSQCQQLYRLAKSLIPGGTQLLSKRPEMFAPSSGPAITAKPGAARSSIWTAGGTSTCRTWASARACWVLPIRT